MDLIGHLLSAKFFVISLFSYTKLNCSSKPKFLLLLEIKELCKKLNQIRHFLQRKYKHQISSQWEDFNVTDK